MPVGKITVQEYPRSKNNCFWRTFARQNNKIQRRHIACLPLESMAAASTFCSFSDLDIENILRHKDSKSTIKDTKVALICLNEYAIRTDL